MPIITTIAELDEKIAECIQAEAISDDALRAVFGSFGMAPPTAPTADPFTAEYRETQLRHYREIAGKAYSTDNERTPFDVEAAVTFPFPFATRSCVTTGRYFMIIGFLLRAMELAPRSRVVEFGAGWGLTSLWLAQLGHEVTAIDIEPRFCELIRRRAARDGLAIEVVNSDFFWIESAGRTFDAALFFESFHHCDDHLRLLSALRRVVASEGKVFFGGEPIAPDFPVPWGLRLDGESLWAIRKNGWLELGFRDDYFRQALARTGWFAERIAEPCEGTCPVWIARHRETAALRFPVAGGRLLTQVGVRHADFIELNRVKSGAGVYGPYIDLSAGRYVARLKFRPGVPLSGRAAADVCCDTGTRQLAQTPLDPGRLGADGMTVSLPFASETDMTKVEVRLICQADFSGAVEGVEIAPLAE